MVGFTIGLTVCSVLSSCKHVCSDVPLRLGGVLGLAVHANRGN